MMENERANRVSVMRASAGFSLVEVLIALVVIGAGLLVLANFQGRLTTGSADAKMRSAALHLAQAEVERLRNMELSEIVNVVNEPLEEPDEVFRRTVTNLGPRDQDDVLIVSPEAMPELMRELRVMVAWDDTLGQEQWVEVITYVAASAFAGSVDIGAGKGSDSTPLIPAPFGGAELVAGKYQGGLPSINEEGGTLTKIENAPDVYFFETALGAIEIIDETTGDALVLEGGNLPARIAGYVYLDSTTNTTTVIATPVSLCVKGQRDNSLGHGLERFPYSCYVAGRNLDNVATYGWYGNVGVLQPETGVNQVDDVCVGAVVDEPITVTAEQARVRWYRGYDNQAPGDWVGSPVLDSDGREILFPIGIVGRELENTPDRVPGFTGHNFLVTQLTGQRTCETRMRAVHENPEVVADEAFGKSASGVFTETGSVFDEGEAAPNPGRLFCFGLFCPEPEPTDLLEPVGCDAVSDGGVCARPTDFGGDYPYAGLLYAGVLNGEWVFTTPQDETATGHAAAVNACRDAEEERAGFIGWLPSNNVLRTVLYEQRVELGGFANQRYWSSDTAQVRRGNAIVEEGVYLGFNNGATGTSALTQNYDFRCLFRLEPEPAADEGT